MLGLLRMRALQRAALPPLIAVATLACAEPSVKPTRWTSWQTLRLETQDVPLLDGSFEMVRSEHPGVRRIETRAQASLFGARIAESRTVTLLDGASGRTRSFVSESSGRGRRYLFADDGYTVEKLSPDATRPVDEWKVDETRRFAFPSGREVFDYYGMLLYLQRAPLRRTGDEVTVYVATGSGPLPFRVVVGESRRAERSFTDIATGQTTTITTREFRMRLIPEDPAAEEGFLRMEGETEIWVEASSMTPIEIIGKVPKVPGRVKLRLAALG